MEHFKLGFSAHGSCFIHIEITHVSTGIVTLVVSNLIIGRKCIIGRKWEADITVCNGGHI